MKADNQVCLNKEKIRLDQSHTPTQTILLQSHQYDHTINVISHHTTHTYRSSGR